ncbi:MAG TPA: hypothetical protein VFB62_05110 [Polyangiaceae bacterium]|nr:hypothetical protein [Polyangiaceae bacterium]
MRDLARETLFQSADLRRDVRLRDTEDCGYVAIAVVIQVQKQQGAIQRIESINERVQRARPFIFFNRTGARVFDVVRFVERNGVALTRAVGPNERDRDVERDAVHPSGERTRRIELRERAPQLRDDLLGDVFAIGRVTAIGGGHLEDDPAMALEQLGEPSFSVVTRERSRGQRRHSYAVVGK